ncbi:MULTISPECIES: ATP-binding protein [unclassified Microbacterium]|uniref:ATP-binding protein n=1 Tax=unclassified Microbacterium TaxID=2609290 RepID=UPI00214AC8FA|nr:MULTISPECIES: ATP-binding protein [unclassified Microbacterium]MCR2783781.1 ATP-binding protein [Microbacterium sp. zg.B96]WIM15367.1 ATP-binding protein [Microbacterium sp. zg-B96]
MPNALTIGTRHGSSATAHVLATKLNRHTFWCGQSGSGKTYALGVLLEQLILGTRLPIVILDPNSDFVRVKELRDTAPDTAAAQWRQRDIRVLRPGDGEADRLRVRFLGMTLQARAAVLRIDPIIDPEDYNAMLRLESHVQTNLRGHLVQWLRDQDDPSWHRLALRLENLGIADLDVWAWGGEDLTQVIDQRADATVIDLGGFATPIEPKAAALASLDHLWSRRHERIGRLIVIDEAHNLCSPDPATEIDRLLTERIVQIAAEGRKYGLWLLLSTQRPSKVHPNALSQCDNLALMKMSSLADVAEIGRHLGYAPDDLLAQAPSFRQGQALFAGGFTEAPQIVQMGARLTQEGGFDVPIELR